MHKKKNDDIEIIGDDEPKKRYDFKLNKAFKRFFLFFIVSLFLEFMFALFVFDTYYKESVINITLFSLISASVFSLLSGFFKGKGNRIVIAIILFLLGFIYSVQLVFYSSFKTFFSFTVLGLGDQLESFIGTTLKMIWKNIIYILILFLPFIIYMIFKKKLDNGRNKLSSYFVYLFIMVLSIGLFIVHMNKSKGKDSGTYYLYHDVNSIELNVQTLGVLNSYTLDIYRAINGFEEKIVEVVEEDNKKEDSSTVFKYKENIIENLNFDKSTSNNDIKTINNYMKKESATEQNQYTGLFKGYNLVYITAESFSQIGVSEELTPTLYKLTHTGFIFDNYYTPNNLSTIGGEFQSLTGLYPDSSILSKWRSGSNYFPYGLGTIFKGLGYKTYAYHNNWYGFQDRHKYLKSQGFTNYLGCYNGLEKRMNCKPWPQSDDDMMKVTIPDYINNTEPFMAYYMTVSGHFGYSWSGNSMSAKNKKYVKDLKGATESAKAYVATQIELDRALKRLLDELEKAGKLDNTVIVLLADHYPYNLDLNSVNSLSSYKRDSIVEVNHNHLILWNNKLNDIHIDKVCMSSDVIPTVYNLFGIEYDSRLFTGRDILSTSSGLAVFNNRSWVSDKGTYFASSHKFVPKETMENQDEYVKNMNAIVKNRLNIAKLIIKNNYYNYLFK
jgi:phosphoglycerol transferase MdoB-like AlkP superfamily enzyme